MKSFTVSDILKWAPCPRYTPKRIEELWAGREALTALDVLSLDIPPGDRLWAVLRRDWLPAKTLRAFARWCALQVIHLWDCPKVVKRYLKTGDESIRDAAYAYAEDAATRYAIWTIVKDTSKDTANAFARSAARAVAHAASEGTIEGIAEGIARNAARDVVECAILVGKKDAAYVRAAQIEKLREMIEPILAKPTTPR